MFLGAEDWVWYTPSANGLLQCLIKKKLGAAKLTPDKKADSSDKKKAATGAAIVDSEFRISTYLKSLQTTDSHGIVKFLTLSTSKYGCWTVMERLTGGDLVDELVRLHETATWMSEAELEKLAVQLFGAVSFLHANGVTHGDIKPPNICLVKRGDLSAGIRFVDFGAGKLVNDVATMGKFAFSSGYTSPELLVSARDARDKKRRNKRFSTQVFLLEQIRDFTEWTADDVWRTGVTLLTIAGKRPFWVEYDAETGRPLCSTDRMCANMKYMLDNYNLICSPHLEYMKLMDHVQDEVEGLGPHDKPLNLQGFMPGTKAHYYQQYLQHCHGVTRIHTDACSA
ncbi:hypothetical protein MNV49_000895 [Pseudohyphozyma bogoriensis]|nr:hypothetical protein MNV49_000895 [Pseudohyphozyma bogoriensis]